jgi:hypothetical protein
MPLPETKASSQTPRPGLLGSEERIADHSSPRRRHFDISRVVIIPADSTSGASAKHVETLSRARRSTRRRSGRDRGMHTCSGPYGVAFFSSGYPSASYWLLIRYYQASDRIFGGTRYARYQEAQRWEAECSKRKVAKLKKQLQEFKGARLNEEMLYQALTNPHFVATNHQDRP